MSPAAKRIGTITLQWSVVVAIIALLLTLHWRSTLQADSRATERVRQENRDTDQDNQMNDNTGEIKEIRIEHKSEIKELTTEVRAMDLRQQKRHDEVLDRLPR